MTLSDISSKADIWRIRQVTVRDKGVLRDLLDAYLLGLSAFGPVDAAYPYFDLYFEDIDRWAYLIEVMQEDAWNPAGFALVNRHSCSGVPVDHAMAEFCVVPEFRRTGLGQYAANQLIARHPGVWELGVVKNNAVAGSFWRGVAAAIHGVAVIDDGDTSILRFESPDASTRIPSVEG
ncbi:hypothetical protein [Rhizobium sp. NFR03]|uniref:hypothetical protein n=1 Tax=Rhizobium sp. NFR03 TaxID=1566263 RepID=UPI0008B022A7|nr:hypothetical protein [Rhizobium sp. NFR03]SES37382.1 hypothetical protein SAMN03159406_03777 [Rhizobium sp. NFR03]